MHQFYYPNANFSSSHVIITDQEELHHLRNVLRLKKNDPVQLFDGQGKEASGVLQSVSAQEATVEIQSIISSQQKIPSIILACALPKKSKFELIIEKATELGVDEIIPLKTKRTEIKLNSDRLNKKQLRYQTIAINASKQSKRSTVPIIHPMTNFLTALKALTESTTVIIPSLTQNAENLFDALKKIKSPKSISIIIGPEGDFTPHEYSQAHENGCIPVTLGNTILKVETAAICSLSCINLYFHA